MSGSSDTPKATSKTPRQPVCTWRPAPVRVQRPPASEMVNVAVVGAGGMGRGVARELMKLPDVRIIAVADPAADYQDDFFYKARVGRLPLKGEIEAHYGAAAPGFRCADYEDFRVMLRARKGHRRHRVCELEPPHVYVPVTPCVRGSVYCEKPMAHNLREPA